MPIEECRLAALRKIGWPPAYQVERFDQGDHQYLLIIIDYFPARRDWIFEMDRPLTSEDIWGLPKDQLPKPDQARNYFNEHQPIISPQARPGGLETHEVTDGESEKDQEAEVGSEA